VGRKPVVLSALAEDTIHHVFHKMLDAKIYLTITTLSSCEEDERNRFSNIEE
jgi:hypothetical protein